MLDATDIRPLIAQMWQLHLSERGWLDRIFEYTKGLRGRPEVPEGAGEELENLAKLSIKNVLSLVRDSFAQNLSVVGYRTETADENDPAWGMWQRNRMDARQHEVHRPALTYGCSYVTVTPSDDGPVFRPRSPRQIMAVYDDPTVDPWPQYALEVWVTEKNARRHRRGLLFDDTHMYELDLGWLPINDIQVWSATRPISVVEVEDAKPHGASHLGRPVCPVVRFINDRDADDMIVGEIAPLIQMQQAINNVNFDRLIASRWGVQPQKVISGWSGTKTEVLKASSMRVWAFEDPDVKTQSFPVANVEQYNSILEEMLRHVAMVAQISPAQVIGQISNVSAEALASMEANQQRKLAAKRESFGESWEQVLRLAAEMDGDSATAADSGAEVVWRDTEARTFGAIVDGMTKLASEGVPIEELLDLVPGMTQQKIRGIQKAMRSRRVASLVDRLTAPTPPPSDDDEQSGSEGDDNEGDSGDAGGDGRVSASAGQSVA